MDTDLDAKLNAKEARSAHASVEAKKADKARRLGYDRRAQVESVYKSGGSTASVDALAEVAAGGDWLRDGEVREVGEGEAYAEGEEEAAELNDQEPVEMVAPFGEGVGEGDVV